MFSPLAGYEVAVPGGDDFVLPVWEDFELDPAGKHHGSFGPKVFSR